VRADEKLTAFLELEARSEAGGNANRYTSQDAHVMSGRGKTAAPNSLTIPARCTF
jgi:hypothetical protein